MRYASGDGTMSIVHLQLTIRPQVVSPIYIEARMTVSVRSICEKNSFSFCRGGWFGYVASSCIRMLISLFGYTVVKSS